MQSVNLYLNNDSQKHSLNVILHWVNIFLNTPFIMMALTNLASLLTSKNLFLHEVVLFNGSISQMHYKKTTPTPLKITWAKESAGNINKVYSGTKYYLCATEKIQG